MELPPITSLRPRERVRVITESGQRVGYVESATPEGLVLEPGAYNVAAPVFAWSEVRRIERRVLNPVGPIAGGFLGAIALAAFGVFVAFLVSCCDPAGFHGVALILISIGLVVGGLIGGVCGMVVRHWELAYDGGATMA